MIKNQRILILTASHLCRNPRVLKEATSLADAGYQVTVLGVRAHRPSMPLDAALRRSSAFAHHEIEMLDGLGAFYRRARIRVSREMLRRFKIESPQTLGPASDLLQMARSIPADLTIAHVEPALWAGCQLLDDGRRVAADFEDWHSEDLPPAHRSHRPLRLLRSIESRLIKSAAYTSTTSHALSDALRHRYGGPPAAVITNAFPLQPDPFAQNPLQTNAAEPPRLCWFSQTLGPDRGLEEFLDTWALTRTPSRVILLGAVSAGYRSALLARLPDSRRRALKFRNPVAPGDLPSWLAQHHIGLALERSNIASRDLTITNKMLQYLNAGLAVVATPTAGQREVLLEHPQAGLLLDPAAPSPSAERLDQLLCNPSHLGTCRAAARRAAESKYCWEQQGPRFLSLVKRALQ